MPLTDASIRNAKFSDKQFKLYDSQGLYVLVNKSGKYFRLDFRFGGKRKTMSLGVYPNIKLSDAREKRDTAKKLIKDGINPIHYRKQQKIIEAVKEANGFEVVSREWFEKNQHTWTEGHSQTIIRRLEYNIFPWLGSKPIGDVTPPELLDVLRRIENRGALETAHRVKQICSQIFRYAIATGRCDRDPATDLKGAIPPTKPKRMATIIDPIQIGELLRAIDGYHGHLITKCAMSLAPLVFVRPGELRKAEWKEFDLERGEWRIPGQKMKAKVPHLVPLSNQAIQILNEIQPLTGRGKYVFPSLRSKDRPMSNNTVLAALRRMGYSKEEMTGHGFRAMASTMLHERGWSSNVVEKQLAHAERNKVKASYNHAEFLSERKRLMQEWADYLDELRNT
jgi:integrase